MSAESYAGQELDLFKLAVNWKAYFQKKIGGFVLGDVLEVGAGLGGTTRVLCDGSQRSWLCLEPDAALAAEIEAAAARQPFAIEPAVSVGGLETLTDDQRFDTILYIDVLEHIEEDRAQLELARAHLKPGGAVVVLSPAFQFLFSEFDRSVGHFRRYDKRSLRAVVPGGLACERLFYLDSVGMLTSLLNRFVLRQDNPNAGQIQLWDNYIVRLSRLIDPLLGHSFGRSIIAILRAVEVA